MIAYTGIETVSNLSEEARDPLRTIPRSILMVAIAVFAIYFTLPLIALSAMPVHHGGQDGARPAPPKGFANDPVLGVVENLGLARRRPLGVKVYVGILAATILFIATNAGVIGASRITYAMAGYRQLPSVFRRIHPKFKTPWISLVVFGGFISILVLLPGKTNFLGTMLLRSARCSRSPSRTPAVIQLRRKQGGRTSRGGATRNLALARRRWPLFAVIGGLGTGLSWLDVVIEYRARATPGLGWLALGFVGYVVYRRRCCTCRCGDVRAPSSTGERRRSSSARILVPIAPGYPSDEAMDIACRLAAERRASIVAVTANRGAARSPAARHGSCPTTCAGERAARRGARDRRLVRHAVTPHRAYPEHRARDRRRGDPARWRSSSWPGHARAARVRPSPDLGDAVDFVLRHAPCRVMIVTAREQAAA